MLTDVSEVRAVSIIIIALMMEAARTSETSVDIQLATRQYISEDSELHTRRRENLKSHMPARHIQILNYTLLLFLSKIITIYYYKCICL
jgi:hypothetical protein